MYKSPAFGEVGVSCEDASRFLRHTATAGLAKVRKLGSMESMKASTLALIFTLLAVIYIEAQDKPRTPVVIPDVKGRATTTRFGDGYITRTSEGKSYTTSKFGSGWITRSSDGATYTTSKFGDGAITRGNNGETVTTSRFGTGTISRSSTGATTTTSKFGDGNISRSSSGGSATTSRFGSGFSTSQTGKRCEGTTLVLPAPEKRAK